MSSRTARKVSLNPTILKHGPLLHEEVNPDLKYGCRSWRPSCLQFLTRASWVIAFCSIANGVMSGAVNGLMGTMVSSIEKRYQLTSFESSLIVVSFDAAMLPVLVITSYFLTKKNRPRLIAYGVLIANIGSLLFALPHFLSEHHTVKESGEENLCSVNETLARFAKCSDDAQREISSGNLFLVIFILGRVLSGIGCSAIQILSLHFFDDITTKETSSLAISSFIALGILGPAVGFVGGAFLLNFYVDIGRIDISTLAISKEDSQWVGAWWMGYILFAAVGLLFGIPIFGFPHDLPGAQEIRAAKVSESHTKKSDNDEDFNEQPVRSDFSGSFADFRASVKSLFSNPAYLCVLARATVGGFAVNALSSYGAKYMENQFRLPSYYAGAIFGLLAIPSGVGGNILGGLIIKKFKLQVRGILKMELVCILLSLCACFGCFVNCPPIDLAGVTIPYNESTLQTGPLSSCNAQCGCSLDQYNSICGADDIFYFSPCFAGCQVVEYGKHKEYFNCSCIPAPSGDGGMATSQFCAAPCNSIIIFSISLFILMFLTCITWICDTTLAIRCVRGSERGISLGFKSLVVRLLGAIPGPVVLGALLDQACLLRDESCGLKGACLWYDNNKTKWYLCGLLVASSALGTLFVLLMLRIYKPPRIVNPKESDARKTAEPLIERNVNQNVSDNVNRRISQRSDEVLIADQCLTSI